MEKGVEAVAEGQPQQPERKKLRKDLKPEEVLSRLILRRIIKENHASPIKQIAFNFTKPANSNLVATVGGNQVPAPPPPTICFISHDTRAQVMRAPNASPSLGLLVSPRRACTTMSTAWPRTLATSISCSTT